MIILVSGATRELAERPRPYVGRLIVPKAQNRPAQVLWPDVTWAMDNGAFGTFHAEAFVEMLYTFYDHRATCQFVAVPDVVGDAERTLARFYRWQCVVAAYDYPVGFVAQDGLTIASTPWDYLSALFIGGTTEFKLGSTARDLAAVAKAKGKWVHMGRVNSLKRLAYAEEIGCDSVDGSGFSRFPGSMLARVDRYYSKRRARIA